jgi:hypothetical protein
MMATFAGLVRRDFRRQPAIVPGAVDDRASMV